MKQVIIYEIEAQKQKTMKVMTDKNETKNIRKNKEQKANKGKQAGAELGQAQSNWGFVLIEIKFAH